MENPAPATDPQQVLVVMLHFEHVKLWKQPQAVYSTLCSYAFAPGDKTGAAGNTFDVLI